MEVEAAPQLLLVLLLACLSAVATAQKVQRVNFNDGEICKREGSVSWTCTALKNCHSAKQQLGQRILPLLCNFNGKFGKDSIVCCRPEEGSPSQPNPTPVRTTSSAVGAKSLQKCREYAKSVFTVLDDPPSRIDNCANVEPLILKGKTAKPREYPHMALIGYVVKRKVKWLCGGSLISERFVLSAAHCTGGSSGLASWVRLGEYNLNSDLDEKSGMAQLDEYRIEERINHPGYIAKQPYDDIALYRLDKVVRFNEFIRPACIHTTYSIAKPYAIATGWGYTEWMGVQSDILQKGNFTIISSQVCKNAWKSLFLVNFQTNEGIRDASQMCAGDVKSGVDTCQGDSGGPLQVRLSDPYCMYSVIGITSLGFKCGSNTPGVYTRVSHYIQWIESIVWP